MNEKHEHRRENEPYDVEHKREDDYAIPASAKWIAAFINRIGFPIFAFCVLSYFYVIKMDENTVVLRQLRDVMMAVKVSLDARR